MTRDEPVLSVRDATLRRGAGPDAFRLEIPSFDLSRGACVALTGASGSGKSTMLDLLGCVLRPERADRFRVSSRDEAVDVADLWRRGDNDGLADVRARSIGYVLQTGGLLPFLDAAANIRLSPSLLGEPVDDGWIERLTTALGIQSTLTKKPAALSIGERQRVAVARALAHRPSVLLADEPTAALDPTQATAVMELLLSLVRSTGTSAVIVTHDWPLIASFGLDRVEARSSGSGEPPATQFVH